MPERIAGPVGRAADSHYKLFHIPVLMDGRRERASTGAIPHTVIMTILPPLHYAVLGPEAVEGRT